MRKLSRLGVAVGGFLMMTGMILTGIALLALFNLVDVSVFMDKTHMLILMLTLLSIGILDFAAGMILLRR